MAKRRSSRRKPPAGEPLPPQRNASLDTLRGAAILLMVLDHAVGILLGVSIEFSSVRFWTRLSMPLFCLLMGYFLTVGKPLNRHRYLQIAIAMVVINAAYWPLYDKFEILASLLLAFTVLRAVGKAYPWFVGMVLLYPVDPLDQWFDYAPSLVISFVTLGMILRQRGLQAALLIAAGLTTGAFWLRWLSPGDPSQYLFYFLLPAIGLLSLGVRYPDWKWKGLTLAGRFPLTCYLTQYFIIFGLAWWLAKTG